MAIKTVTNANLADFVAERTAGGSKIATGEEQVAAADAAPPSTDGSPTPGHPVIKPGIAETNSAAPDPGNATPSAKTSRRHDVENRMDELTRQRKEIEEFAEDEYAGRLRAEARVAALEAELREAKPKVEQPKSEELKRPSPKDFETQDAYDAAMEAYDQRRDAKVREQAIVDAERTVAIKTQNAQMAVRIDAAKKDYPDFADVLEAANKRTANIPEHIKAAFFESDFGGHLAYALASDAVLEKRIFSLTPAKALIELGKLEDKIEAKFAKPVVTTVATPMPETTRAPAPITTVRGGDGDVRKDLTKPMPFREYKAQRLAERRARR